MVVRLSVYSVGPHFTPIYVGRFELPLVGAKCITEHAHASYKQLDYELEIFYEVIVDEGEARIDYHLIEIESK